MGASRARLFAGLGVGVTVAAEIGSVLLGWGGNPAKSGILFGLYEVTIAVIGALIVARHPRSPIGWILLGFALLESVLSDLVGAYGRLASQQGWPGGALAEAIGLATWVLGALMWALALLYIPTGRLLRPRWRLVTWVGVLGVAIYLPGFVLDPGIGDDFIFGTNPYGVAGLPHGLLVAVGGGLLCGGMVASVVSVVMRYRTAGPVERLQLKWVGLSGLILVVLLPVDLLLWSSSPVIQAATPVLLSLAVLCLGAAVLRYRLFDVDLIVNRTVVYLTLTVGLGAAYSLTAIALGAILGGFSPWTAAGATLVAAAAFRPLRRAIQGVVDRRFDREQYSARMRIDAFLEGLRAGTEQPQRVEDLLREVLHDPALSVLLLVPGSGQYRDVRGKPAEVDPARPTAHLDRAGARDVVVQYTPTDIPTRENAVRAAVEHSQLAIEIARLQGDLNRQLVELDASRARIATAADDERRRIQRDLHDGAQQRLVIVGISLRATESRLRADDRFDDADRLDSAVADLAATIEELRDLTHQLPLAQLDSGIGAAFRELAERAPLPVVVDAPVGRLEPSLEATAYFVGCEGLTNVIKHARASAVTLRATRRSGALVVSVADNGVGGAAGRPGSGLDGLADRVQAMGGRLLVSSDTGGTLLTAELPCA